MQENQMRQNATDTNTENAVNNQTKKRKVNPLELFLSFFRIGLFTFGGGYAMIPLIQREAVEKKKWVSDDDILEIIAIAESTPGPIAINSATFVGYRAAGFWGSFFATFGVVLPSFLIIFAISSLLREFNDIHWVKAAFWGIRAGVLALVAKALWTMYKKTKKSLFAYIIMAAAFLCVALLNLNVIYIIIGCGLAGLIFSWRTKWRKEK